jgi:hypothetical protein
MTVSMQFDECESDALPVLYCTLIVCTHRHRVDVCTVARVAAMGRAAPACTPMHRGAAGAARRSRQPGCQTTYYTS